ncbi:MAG: T9SS type A sorting domain-containing protein [Bacteroidota bacterium]
MQRSADGVNYNAIGFVNSSALGGNSTSQLDYVFTDNSVVGSRQYYRLRQMNFDGNSELSNIVLIKGDKPVTLTIDGLFPNPAGSVVNVLIATANKDKITLIITDIAGRKVIEQLVSVEAGSNTIPVDINKLTRGTYIVKLVCPDGHRDNCESAVGKLVKQ